MSGIKCIDHLGNEFNSKKEMAAHYGISNKRLNARLKAGYSIEDALTKPLRDLSVQDHLGNIYVSTKEMCKHYQIAPTLYRGRLRRGYSVREALTIPKDALISRVSFTDHRGKTFYSITECAEYYNIPMKTLSYRLNHHWSVEAALTTPVRGRKCKDHEGNVFSTEKEMCLYWNISYNLYHARIHDGWSVEDALTKDKVYSRQFSNEKFLSRLHDLCQDDFSPLETYKGNGVNINVKCNICGKSWFVKPYNLFAGYGCPHCKESSYEKRVRELLVEKDVEFSTQYYFSDCLSSGGRPSRFDFYISGVGLIEVDGEGHFYQIMHWNLEKAVRDDKIKTRYCEDHEIPLLRIRYDQITDGTFVDLISGLIADPSYYIKHHNKYLDEDAYYAKRGESISAKSA